MERTYSEWSRKRLKRVGIINRFIDGSISRAQAAELAGISERQVTRIAKEVKDLGDEAYLHKNIGNHSATTYDAEVKEAVLEVYSRPEYEDVNFLHFCDSLAERHGIQIPYSTLESILKTAGNVSPKKHKSKKIHRRRPRKLSEGELIQIDASPYDWLRTGENLSLHGGIDDATGNPTGLYLCKNECRLGYFEIVRQGILRDGVPLSFYSDNHTIFRSPKTGKLTSQEILLGKQVPFTQFGRAIDELGANIIFARTPQAKGRVERMWNTLQSRLPVEFAAEGIRSIEQANEYLQERFIDYYKERWAVEAKSTPIYVPWREDEDIDTILCVKELRKTDNAGVFSINGKAFQVLDRGFPMIPKGRSIEVLLGVRIGIKVRYDGRVYDTVRYLKPDKPKIPSRKIEERKAAAVKPHLLHGSDAWKEIWHAEDYNSSLQFLYDLFLSDADIFKSKNADNLKEAI